MTDNELLLAISDMMDKKLQSTLQSELQPIKDDIRDMKQQITSIEMHLENTTDQNIQLLAENYVPAAKRYEKESSKIESMQADIEVMKKVIQEHSHKLQNIS